MVVRYGIPSLYPCLLKCNLVVEMLEEDSFEDNIPGTSL